MLRTGVLLSVFLFASTPLLAQQVTLPRYMTADEYALIPAYRQQLASQRSTDVPPNSSVRAAAEWEEVSHICLAWTGSVTGGFYNILGQIAENTALECTVLNVCTDTTQVKNYLSNQGIALTNMDFIEAPLNSIWMRDYGQWNVYTNDVDSLLLIDMIYNRPRFSDNVVPEAIADHLGFPHFRMESAPYDLVHTGGNFMVDGAGLGFSSELILEENFNGSFNTTDRDEFGVDTMCAEFLGLNDYAKMTVLPFDGINHIDMHMKLLNENTLLVGEYPVGVADGPQIEANIQHIISQYETFLESDFKVVRIPMPVDASGNYPDVGGDYRTYTNSIIINKTILVPTYEERYDTTALGIYRQLMPGYNVVGINCNAIIPLGGALHCITKEVMTADPLLISHQEKTFDEHRVINPFFARIQHRSGIASATLHYTTDRSQGYTTTPMTLFDADKNLWIGSFTPHLEDSVFYYFSATANSGKQQVRPMPAPQGYYRYELRGGVQVGIKESISDNINVYPNPATASFTIAIEEEKVVSVVVTNVLGQTVYKADMQKGRTTLDSADWPSGIYYLSFTNGNTESFKKLVVR